MKEEWLKKKEKIIFCCNHDNGSFFPSLSLTSGMLNYSGKGAREK